MVTVTLALPVFAPVGIERLMVAVAAEPAVVAALVIDIQLLVAVVIIFITAACAVLIIGCCIGRVAMSRLIALSVLECSAHALISSH